MILLTVFDLDDTLFDHRHSHRWGMTAARRVLGLELPAERAFALAFEQAVSRTTRAVIRGNLLPRDALHLRLARASAAVGLVASHSRVKAAATHYQRKYCERARPVPGARRAVRAARDLGPTVVLSNGFGPAQREKLEWCRLASAFDAELYSSDLGVVKPNQRAFSACERTFGLRAPYVCMIGDSLELDIRPARVRGWRAAWIGHRTLGSVDEKLVRIESLHQLPSLLAKWCAE